MRILVRLAFKVYHRKIHLIDVQKVPSRGAVLMTPNHPSAFMEACLLACYQPRSLYFLVRGDVFKNPRYLPFLRGTHQVPIFRARDGFSNLRKNEQTFQYCYATLGLGRTVVIFPEVGTVWEKKLRPLQRGAAKIAFGALEEQPGLPLKILPVGVNFEDPRKFQSDVVVRFGDTIDLADFHTSYAENPQAAIQEVTSHMEAELEKLVYAVHDKEQENLLDTALQIYRNSYYQEQFPIIERDEKRFRDEMQLAGIIRSGARAGFNGRLAEYGIHLEAKGITDNHVFLAQKETWRLFLSVIFSTPVWAAGYLLCAWPALLSRKITRSKMKDQAFVGPIQLGLGIIIYLLIILLLLIALSVLFGWMGVGLTLIFVSVAYFVARSHANHRDRWKSMYLKSTRRKEMQDLAKEREQINHEMKEILENETSLETV